MLIATPVFSATASTSPKNAIKASGAGYFDELTSTPSYKFIIPNQKGPQSWSCTYMDNTVRASSQGTTISIDKSFSSSRPYTCGEMISRTDAQYGTYTVDMIPTDTRGHVTGFFIISSNGGSTEIDIELTGINSNVVHLNVWKNGVQHPVKIPLGFDAAKDWHTYSFEWREDFIAWSIDGKEVYRQSAVKTVDPRFTPCKLVLNSWTNNHDDGWAGKFSWPTGRSSRVESRFRKLKYTP
ncbi:hypothetical protein BGZ99_004163 [Dissophora globulifera]|uniref:GH16 domain-containing protein n=1 Tax=Dissophora globulifera TaxID=979702 RepID=A0A9P6RN63_9FUNG|nr:hypothetical protein BGZ99_004163 [Dissophora globulifera]